MRPVCCAGDDRACETLRRALSLAGHAARWRSVSSRARSGGDRRSAAHASSTPTPSLSWSSSLHCPPPKPFSRASPAEATLQHGRGPLAHGSRPPCVRSAWRPRGANRPNSRHHAEASPPPARWPHRSHARHSLKRSGGRSSEGHQERGCLAEPGSATERMLRRARSRASTRRA